MYNIYYIGAQNSERIDFCQWPYMVTGGDLFDGEFDAIEDDERIQGWERKITSKKLNIEIHAVGVSLEQAIDQLENVAEKDVLNTTPGRLYVGSSYMKGWLVGTTKDRCGVLYTGPQRCDSGKWIYGCDHCKRHARNEPE